MERRRNHDARVVLKNCRQLLTGLECSDTDEASTMDNVENFGTLRAMKKSALRVTKWLGDVPIETRCSLCPETVCHAASPHHGPQKADYIESYQRAFGARVAY